MPYDALAAALRAFILSCDLETRKPAGAVAGTPVDCRYLKIVPELRIATAR